MGRREILELCKQMILDRKSHGDLDEEYGDPCKAHGLIAQALDWHCPVHDPEPSDVPEDRGLKVWGSVLLVGATVYVSATCAAKNGCGRSVLHEVSLERVLIYRGAPRWQLRAVRLLTLLLLARDHLVDWWRGR